MHSDGGGVSGLTVDERAWGGVVSGVEPHFDVHSREIGRELFAAGSVRLDEAGAELARGSVEPHSVELRREALARGVRYEFVCGCPRGQQQRACAHTYALALALEAAAANQVQMRRRAAAAEPAHLRASRERLERLSAAVPGPRLEADAGGWRILYRLRPGGPLERDALRLVVTAQRRRRDGQWGSERVLDGRTRQEVTLLDPRDRAVLSLLEGAREFDDGPATGEGRGFVLRAERATLCLPRLAATGRLLWAEDEPEDPGLELDDGEPWRAGLEWVAGSDGGGRIEGSLVRGDESLTPDRLVAAASGGWWFAGRRLGRFEPAALAPWLAELAGAAALEVPEEHADAWLGALACVAPEAVEGALELELGEPAAELLVEGAWATGTTARKLPARIRFWYGDEVVELGDPRPLVAGSDGEWTARRDFDAERARVAEFRAAGGEVLDEFGTEATVATAGATDLARRLLEQGWAVESSGRAWRLATGSALQVRSGIDWFDLEGGLQFGSASVGLPRLLAAAADAGSPLVELDDGSFGLLPDAWSGSRGLFGLAQSIEGDALRFGSSQALIVDALLAERSDVELDARYAEVRQRLSSIVDPKPQVEPPGFQGALRPYQREGLGWLSFLTELGLGGCLADDMGLGKTVQLLALLEQRRLDRAENGEEHRPTLVVAPSSLVFNWMDEAARFTPELRTAAYTGPERAEVLERLHAVDLLVTNYALLRRDVLELREVAWDVVVLDEAQAIKNEASQVARASRLLDARQRFALSGTPIENHLGELWSLFEFLNPGMLGRSSRFRSLVKASRSSREGIDLEFVARAVRPFVLRRRKSEVLEDLPERTEQTVHVELAGDERRDYDELRDHYRASLLSGIGAEPGAVGRESIHVLEALLRLRQAACHPGLVDKRRRSKGSAKLEALMERIEEVVESGQKALVFSQFVQFLSIVREALDARGFVHEYLDGSTRDRRAPVERFQSDPDVPLMLISLKAGGTGLNLTAADFVFLIDPWWNPAVEAQAIDRAHRIGRTKPVVAYRLITTGTVEERVLELQEGKRELAAAVLDGAGGSVADLSREDLERLLS
jgi:superfamily II DNA or RNA helicase